MSTLRSHNNEHTGMLLIPVIYASKKTGMVLPASLGKLIGSNEIIAFRSEDSWVPASALSALIASAFTPEACARE